MNYGKVFNNAKWIVICKIMQSLLQLAVGMLSARFLGPSNYGLIKYAASVVAFAMPLMKLGLDATLVHELVEHPEKEGEIIGTSLLMNFLSGLACIGGVVAFSSVINAGEKETIIVCLLYSLSLVFAAFEMVQYWFQYKLMSKYSSLVMLAVYFVVSAYKIFLLATQKSVYWFAVSNSVEFGLVAFSLIAIFLKKGGRLRFSLKNGISMLKKSRHFMVASMMVVVIQNTDHVMLTKIAGKAENGFYSAAITCTIIAQFVFTAIIDSFRPVILENKKENSPEYERNVSGLYCITQYLALVQSIFFTVFAELIVFVLYGADYAATVTVLRILIWYFSFSVMGVVRNVWIVAEQKQKYLWIINLSGVLLNVGLNAILIPYFGACGAAVASLATQIFANFIFGFIFKPIRENNRLLIAGLNPKMLISVSKDVAGMLVKKKK